MNLLDARFTSDNLRNLNEMKLISFLIFENLINFPLITKKKIRNKDIIWNYKQSNNSPLVGQLYVLPYHNQEYSKIKPIIVKECISQINFCFICKNFVECNDYVLQLVLYNHKLGPWPPYNYIIMKE